MKSPSNTRQMAWNKRLSTRLYQNGRYYYDVDTGEYGYGHDSNPARTTRPEVFGGRRYGNAAGQEYTNANDDQEEFGSGGYNAGERAGTERYGNAAAGYHVKVNDQFAGNNGLENQNELYTP
ncbi:hypothetical protein GUJ93_ZPchr0001g31788 [Zizania palustris]|uniref:Uncharacterized protein n=1 Tax=Zizania palustris TaxID=103762 RepID=A0A8J5SDA2_ZIZPA|nr:hypothetical protein GUJ93_ZPchr0001g31788 [Zizania palustris]